MNLVWSLQDLGDGSGAYTPFLKSKHIKYIKHIILVVLISLKHSTAEQMLTHLFCMIHHLYDFALRKSKPSLF